MKLFFRTTTPEFFLANLFHRFANSGAYFGSHWGSFLKGDKISLALFWCPSMTMFLTFSRLASIMTNGVLASFQNFEVLWSVVENISIYVMDNLIFAQRSANNIFHYIAVLKYFSPFYAYVSIPVSANPSIAFSRAELGITNPRAEMVYCVSANTRRSTDEFLTTITACQVTISHVGIIPRICRIVKLEDNYA